MRVVEGGLYHLYIINEYNSYYEANITNIDEEQNITFEVDETLLTGSELFLQLVSDQLVVDIELGEITDRVPLMTKRLNYLYGLAPNFTLDSERKDGLVLFSLRTPIKYSCLKFFRLMLGEQEICTYNRSHDNDLFEKYEFAIPFHNGDAYEFEIFYTIDTDNVLSIATDHSKTFTVDLNGDVAKYIGDISHTYHFPDRSLHIAWEASKDNVYAVRLNDGSKEFFAIAKDNSVKIDRIDTYDSGSINFTVEILADSKYKAKPFVSDYITKELSVTNYRYIDNASDVNFSPVIDVSDCYLSGGDKSFGTVTLSTPDFEHSFEVFVERESLSLAFDEFKTPWLAESERILASSIALTDSRYPDKNRLMEITMDGDTRIYNDMAVTSSNWETGEPEWVPIVGDSFQIPLWYNHKDQYGYRISARVADRWGNVHEPSVISFNNYAPVLSEPDTSLFFVDRRQEVMLGETGSLSSYLSLTNPTPSDSYLSLYKGTLYTGKPSGVATDVDFVGNPLYNYMNGVPEDDDDSNPNNYIRVSFDRKDDTYSLEYSFVYAEGEEEELVAEGTCDVKGNNASDNYFEISKNLLGKEGKYTLRIKSINATGQESGVSSIKYFVYKKAPEIPEVSFLPNEYTINDGKFVFDRKYFTLKIENNSVSENYNGFKYKQARVFFRTTDSEYKSYPDYVVSANVETGEIFLRTNVIFTNGSYEMKVVAYDYAGNSSSEKLIEFDINSIIRINPQSLFTNIGDDESFSWYVAKPQECKGFNWKLSYSNNSEKNFDIIDKGYMNDPFLTGASPVSILDLQLSSGDGFYKLECEEVNANTDQGAHEGTGYWYVSEVVTKDTVSLLSEPVTVIESSDAAIFNKANWNEYAFSKDLASIIFSTENRETGNKLKIKLIHPHDESMTPDVDESSWIETSSVGTVLIPLSDHFEFDKDTAAEGVYTVQLITEDIYGNSNEDGGYYTYHLVFVNRAPSITSINPANSLGYFGLNDYYINYIVSCASSYEDIIGYTEHSEKFGISKFKIAFTSTPGGASIAEKTISSDAYGKIEVTNPLTSRAKAIHDRDGYYYFEIRPVDALGTVGPASFGNFIVDTVMDSDVIFFSSSSYYSKTPAITGNVYGEVSKIWVYPVMDGELDYIPDFKNEKDKWIDIGVTGATVVVNYETLDLTFETNGFKKFYYIVEEESSNTSQVKMYNFSIDTAVSLLPVFSIESKIFYDYKDEYFNISWEPTSDDVVSFDVKLEKIDIAGDGTETVVETYSPGENLVEWNYGAEENEFTDFGTQKMFSAKLTEGVFATGYYRLTVRGYDSYSSTKVNTFRFHYDTEVMVAPSSAIADSKVTLTSSLIAWNAISGAAYYEISYDGDEWVRTKSNAFNLDPSKIIESDAGIKEISFRYINSNGSVSPSVKITIDVDLFGPEKPKVTFYKDAEVTNDNSKVEWIVSFENPLTVNAIYYSFDRVNWHYKLVSGKTTSIVYNKPIVDGEYNIFVYSVDAPIDTYGAVNHNVSETSFASVRVDTKAPAKPTLLGITKGVTYDRPVKIYLGNKEKDVDYFITVNGRSVPEGYEVSTTRSVKHNVLVQARKKNIDKVFDLLTAADDMHFFTAVVEEITLDIGYSKVLASIDFENSLMQIESMPELKKTELITYRAKNTDDNWKILRNGDKISIEEEWEFKITTFINTL